MRRLFVPLVGLSVVLAAVNVALEPVAAVGVLVRHRRSRELTVTAFAVHCAAVAGTGVGLSRLRRPTP